MYLFIRYILIHYAVTHLLLRIILISLTAKSLSIHNRFRQWLPCIDLNTHLIHFGSSCTTLLMYTYSYNIKLIKSSNVIYLYTNLLFMSTTKKFIFSGNRECFFQRCIPIWHPDTVIFFRPNVQSACSLPIYIYARFSLLFN